MTPRSWTGDPAGVVGDVSARPPGRPLRRGSPRRAAAEDLGLRAAAPLRARGAAPADAVERSAVLSPGQTYRYELRRTWERSLPGIGWCLVNPSRADAEIDDATVIRCMGFARSWGFGAVVVRNLFALRATDPAELREHPDPVGPDNDSHLRRAADDGTAFTVCGWGVHGALRGRAGAVARMLAPLVELRHLGLTKAGHPRHPLYLPRTTQLQPLSLEDLP